MNILLKNIALSDAPKISKWKSNPQLAKEIMSSFQPIDINTAEQWIIENTENRNQELRGIYAKNEHTEELVGISRLMFVDYESKNAEFGIYVGEKKYQGQGIGEKALRLMLKIGFEELGLLKIYLKVSEENKRAIKLYQKLDFRQEGCLKEHYYHDGTFENVIFMALFQKDL